MPIVHTVSCTMTLYAIIIIQLSKLRPLMSIKIIGTIEISVNLQILHLHVH